MTKQKVLKDGKIFTCYLEKEHVAHIKKVAAQMSISEGRDISTSEAVRLALQEIYPTSQYKQLSFTDCAKKAPLKKKPSEYQLTLL